MNRKTLAIARGVGAISATIALVAGVTFASLQSSVTLSDSTITTATANLLVWNGSSFAGTANGFTVTNLVPGTPQSFPFYLENNGSADLNITALANKNGVSTPGTLPTETGISDLHNVLITIKDDHSGGTVSTNLFDLTASGVTLPGNPLLVGATGNSTVANTPGNYTITFNINPAGVTGTSASVGGFDITLTGTQTTTP